MPDTLERCKKRKDYHWDREKDRRSGDYAYARARASVPKNRRHLQRGYEVAAHFAEVITANRRDEGGTLEGAFRDHVDRWKRDTGHFSSIARMTAHPSYLRIIGMGREGLPFLLKELRDNPDHWLVALNAITGEDAAPEGATFRDAVDAWIRWGHDKGFC